MLDWLVASDHTIAAWLLQRGVAAIYLVAFLVTLAQFRPLLGERGLQPVPRFVARVPFRRAPSLFHWRCSDRLLQTVAWLGAALSLVPLTGAADHAPVWVSMLVWAALWAVYLSVVNVGQTFYGFGWETLLCEAGFLMIWLGPSTVAPSILIIVMVWWLLIRVEVGAGLIKLRGDPCWRDLTCLDYHHETQPLPGPLSWRAHHLPSWWHRVEVAGNHGAQLIAPLLLVLPAPIAAVGGAVIVLTQLWLVGTGNFAWLNWLTIVLALSAFADPVVTAVLSVTAPATVATPGWLVGCTIAVATLVAVRSVPVVRNMISPTQAMNASFDPLRLVNTYGAFGRITRRRDELVIEGADPDPDRRGEDTEQPSHAELAERVWRPYELKAKPGDPRRRPPQIAPYHLRLDWLMWFAALNADPPDPWLRALVVRLLDGDPGVRRLLRDDPFGGRAPRAVRVRRYRYRFSTPEERRADDVWWVRWLVGDEIPPVTLDAEGRLARVS